MARRKTYTDMFGKKYGRLTVIEIYGADEKGRKILSCVCDCGNLVKVMAYSIISENTKSCGCFSIECIITGNNYKHGMCQTPEYKTWCGIIKRVENINSGDYKDYGGRGIKISKIWRKDFRNFLNDMGKRPSPRHSIERINNNGNYCKSNCKWADDNEQSRNKRNNILIMRGNRVMIFQDWVNKLGITKSAFRSILKHDTKYKLI